MKRLGTLCILMFWPVFGLTADQKQVGSDPLITMFKKQELLLKDMERKFIGKFDELDRKFTLLEHKDDRKFLDLDTKMSKQSSSFLNESSIAANIIKNVKMEFDKNLKVVFNDTSTCSCLGLQNQLMEVISGICRQENNTCPDEYAQMSLTNSCYRVVFNKTSWIEGQAVCRRDRGDLVSIEAEEEQRGLMKLVNWPPQFPVDLGLFWIGGRRISGNWTWTVDGSKFEYDNWYQGYPDPDATADCAMFVYDNTGKLESHTKWGNGHCTNSDVRDVIGFICEV